MFKLVKRAQGAAAFLIIIITVMIILYILFLPPSEREKILKDEETTAVPREVIPGWSYEERGIHPTNIILLKSIGRLSYVPETKIEHAIPSANIAVRTEGNILREISNAYVSRTIFSKKNEPVEFKVKNLEQIKNLMVAFNVFAGEGRLIISLNGKEIFNREVKGRNVQPIIAPKEWLREDNVLVFETDSPGLLFWRKNQYELENIRIIADVISLDAQTSKNLFVIDQGEHFNMANAAVRFTTECDRTKVKKLDVMLNDKVIYSAIPDCGSPARIELDKSYFNPGQNIIQFTTQEGTILLDQIAVTTFLRAPEYRTFFFEAPEDLYTDIFEGRTRIIMEIAFPDDIQLKELTLFINGHIERVSQYEKVFQMDISDYIELGTNSIEFVPEKDLDVTKLTVFWETQ